MCDLFGVQHPLVQAGMIWASGWRLASAVSNSGGLGVIGGGSMYPEVLAEHIDKCRSVTNKPFAVNLPLLQPRIEEYIRLVVDKKVPVVITSAGNPKTFTATMRSHGVKVAHVVSSSAFAVKAELAGVNAVIAEGFEAGGHNGREETTSFILIPAVKRAVKIPVIAAGGIASGRQMLAAMALGADGVQVGTRFVCSQEASSHESFKKAVVAAKEGDTMLSMKTLIPVRLLKNKFYNDVVAAEAKCLPREQMLQLLGRARAKAGMFEGDMDEGELEIGQVSALIDSIQPASEIVAEILEEYEMCRKAIAQ